MKTYYTKLYQYNDWANRLFAKILLNNPFENSKIVDLLAHISAAQFIWLNRVTPLDVTIPDVFESMALMQAVQSVNGSSSMWLEFIEKNSHLDQDVSYKDTEGVNHHTALKDILTHVANHGTHHRGQIATLLRQENIAPPASDFIFYCRS